MMIMHINSRTHNIGRHREERRQRRREDTRQEFSVYRVYNHCFSWVESSVTETGTPLQRRDGSSGELGDDLMLTEISA